MMLWCSVQPIRERKSRMVMESLAQGWIEGARICQGDPPEDGNPFAIYGQVWGAERLIPKAIQTGRPYWYIDNGFWKPGRGSSEGYYRICYRGMMPVYLDGADPARGKATGVRFAPWRKSGRHILFALPGPDYGQALGLSMDVWVRDTIAALKQRTDRPIIVRDKGSSLSLSEHLRDCWALVTHSSNVAVEAVCFGIPVFVDKDAAAAPVGNTDLADLESPRMPSRQEWWNSLMCQQFLPAEMADGTAYHWLSKVRMAVDGKMAA